MSHPAERPATGHIPTRPLRRGPALTELGFGAILLVNVYPGHQREQHRAGVPGQQAGHPAGVGQPPGESDH
ncbi:hypothetical protein ABZ281_37950, partial [Streptomyces sp. NPDC006265]|uniref:hypothetical protein n=1 Tax=Streptomyces sp. NPDC006265 TaxID=3156740 RepID=UPI0033BE1925